MKVDTSVRKGEITLGAALANLDPHAEYTLRAVITDQGRTVKEFTSNGVHGRATSSDGRFA